MNTAMYIIKGSGKTINEKYNKRLLAALFDIYDFEEKYLVYFESNNIEYITNETIKTINKVVNEVGFATIDIINAINKLQTKTATILRKYYLPTNEKIRKGEIKVPVKCKGRPKKLDTKTCQLSREAQRALFEADKKTGIYRLYDENDKIVYIGKSYNLKNRVYSSLQERKASKFDFAVLKSKADTDVYELYYINKYKPILNGDSNSGDRLTIELPELSFSQKFN